MRSLTTITRVLLEAVPEAIALTLFVCAVIATAYGLNP